MDDERTNLCIWNEDGRMECDTVLILNVWCMLLSLNNILVNKKIIPVCEGFFAHLQTDTGVHPASCTVGAGSFVGVNRPGRGADPQPPSSAEVKRV
jgi:hypothetical protein